MFINIGFSLAIAIKRQGLVRRKSDYKLRLVSKTS